MADDVDKSQSDKESEGDSENEIVEGEIMEEGGSAEDGGGISTEGGGASEVVTTEDADDKTEDTEADGSAQAVINLENMIKANNSKIAKLSQELSEAREMLKDVLDGDTT